MPPVAQRGTVDIKPAHVRSQGLRPHTGTGFYRHLGLAAPLYDSHLTRPVHFTR